MILAQLPEAEPIFDEDQVTDRSSRFMAAEIVREKLMRRLGAEVPYQLSVEVEHFEQDDKMLKISAIIWVERQGQKAIVIGKQGAILKSVGSDARKDMELLFEQKVFLKLWVKVKTGWSDDERALRQFGYSE
ncbi:GTPase Era [Candidatus Venteria ishoeyi]|uniref:GTPase Era n=1 Tax=Candidatus Venteria ishoeyi TaxID=1899563 RepID=A0A1H6F942_9GAMM|nr:GTPase Era [Candidatus Venteria ishoeyi]